MTDHNSKPLDQIDYQVQYVATEKWANDIRRRVKYNKEN